MLPALLQPSGLGLTFLLCPLGGASQSLQLPNPCDCCCSSCSSSSPWVIGAQCVQALLASAGVTGRRVGAQGEARRATSYPPVSASLHLPSPSLGPDVDECARNPLLCWGGTCSNNRRELHLSVPSRTCTVGQGAACEGACSPGECLGEQVGAVPVGYWECVCVSMSVCSALVCTSVPVRL